MHMPPKLRALCEPCQLQVVLNALAWEAAARMRWEEPASTSRSLSRARPGATLSCDAAAQAPAATTASAPPAQPPPPATSPGASARRSHAAASRWTSSSVSACRASTQLGLVPFSHTLCGIHPVHFAQERASTCFALHPGPQVRVCQERTSARNFWQATSACSTLGSATQCMARNTQG